MKKDEHKPLSRRDRKVFNLATVGGLDIEEAFRKVYTPKDHKGLLTLIGRKRKNRPDLFASISKHHAEIFNEAKEAQRHAAIEAATKSALTAIEKRERLRQIIEGETEVQEIHIIKGVASVVKRKPNVQEVVRAIDLDNKLAGHYPDIGLRHEAGDGFIELMKALTVKKKDQARMGSGDATPTKK